jgi:NAD(P)-dependent dehydrogenase (short-subunit alcohol dehydrogenase family)
MLRQKSGSIINVSTTLVDQPIAGVGAAVQIMLKGALNAVTRALAIEYAKEGIRVNTIAPGVINTPMHKPETHDFLKGLHPVGRLALQAVRRLVSAIFLKFAEVPGSVALFNHMSQAVQGWYLSLCSV